MKTNNRDRKRKYRVVIFMVILLVTASIGSFPAKYQKPHLYIKVNGTGSMAKGGDYADFVGRNDTFYSGLNDISDSYTIAIKKSPYFRGYGGEIGVDAGMYAVGISVEYIEKNFHLDYHYADPDTDFENNFTRDFRFSAVPIFIYIHYKLINTSFLKGYLTIGEGVYLATYRDDREQSFANYDLTFVKSYITGKKNRLGFHAGATVDLTISRNLAVFVEAVYRLVSFKEIAGKDYYLDDNLESANEGFLYYTTNNRTGEARLSLEETAGVFWTAPRLAELDLNGFSLRAGIKFTFGGKKKATPIKAAPLD